MGGGASRCRALREVRRGGEGETESEGWIRESGESDATLDAETEEEEGDHAPLAAFPWGMQESGERGTQGDARAGGSDGGKDTSATANEGETRGHHGAWSDQGGKK